MTTSSQTQSYTPQPQGPSLFPLVPPFPKIIYIEPTNACNCNCTICPRHNMQRKTGLMKMSLFKAITDQLVTYKPELRLFNFGEPLLHPALAEMISYARGKGLNPNFQSNGILLDQTHLIPLLDTGLNYFGVSVNGITEAEYASIRPGHRMADIKNNLLCLRELCHQKNCKVHVHINAQILATEKDQRRQDIKDFVTYWAPVCNSLSVSGISLFDRIGVVQGGQNRTVTQANLPPKAPSTITCMEPFDRLIIKWDGRVTPCCADYDATLVLGDAARQSIQQIWEAAPITHLRHLVHQKNFLSSPLCKSCPKLYSQEFTILFRKNIPTATL